MTRVVGLISGTSVDGIDAVLVDIHGQDLEIKIDLVAGATYPYPKKLRERILEICVGARISMAELAQLDDAIACAFAEAANRIQVGHEKATLIGSHGQTIYHQPPERIEREKINSKSPIGYSLQIGRGAVIANLTNTKTINNFRVADIAVGGHGAPLVPRVDLALFGDPQISSCIQNIGGIANLAYIPVFQGNYLDQVCGWDTGPGNSLLDLAVEHLTDGAKTYDENGAWGASGNPCQALVEKWLQHEYFHLAPPKSTGKELFGKDYLQQCLQDASEYQLTPEDILATLTEITASSIVHSYRTFLPQMPQRVLLCGGGNRNLYLKQRLQELLTPIPVLTTDEVGISADFKEAIAFAVLAYWRESGAPGNLPSATGASHEVLLGEIHQPRIQELATSA